MKILKNISIFSFLAGGSINCYRNSTLIKIDSQPTALNFVNYSVKNDASNFMIIYEEKTKTIIRLTRDIFEPEFEAISDTIVLMIKNYFEEQLGLISGEYFFVADLLKIGNGSFVNMVIGCEILQFEDKITEEE